MNKSITPKGYVSRVKIQVTEQSIKQACKADSRHCMIADAIAAQLPGVRSISVDMMTIRWSDPATGWRYIYLTPKPAQIALIKFDKGLEVQPFSFQVRSGHATPMNLGGDKNRKRAHRVRESKIEKVTDKTIAHSIGSKSVPMWPRDKDCTPLEPGKTPAGRPREWHPSHNSLRRYGLRGFTNDV